MITARHPKGMRPPLLVAIRRRAERLRSETFALYLAARDPRTPWYAKLLAAVVTAYAFSPVDLIPDFIPVLGYLDDAILVPLGIAAAIRLVPVEVLAECRAEAEDAFRDRKPVSRLAGAGVVLVWIALMAVAVAWASRVLG